MSLAAKADDPFVPFGPATGAIPKSSGSSPNLKVIPAAAVAEAFAPLHAGTAGHSHGSSRTGNAAPTISLQKDGERITGIRIECGCGEVIELACHYAP